MGCCLRNARTSVSTTCPGLLRLNQQDRWTGGHSLCLEKPSPSQHPQYGIASATGQAGEVQLLFWNSGGYYKEHSHPTLLLLM